MSDTITDAIRDRLKGYMLRQLRPDFVEQIKAARAPANEYGLDPFGFSVDYSLSALAPLAFLYKNYFRVKTTGIENVPRGRVLLISNHSGQLPFDAAMIGMAMLIEGDPPRAMRSMVEKWMPTLPYVSVFFARVGQVVGTPENCRRLLAAGEMILVMPEGVRGLNKLWRDRYRLADFGLGFMRLALETDTPIVPVAVVGAEEQAPALVDIKPLARLLRMPAMPLTPTILPFPLPTRYHLRFGEPLHFTGNANDEDVELERKVKVVRSTLQAMINRGLRERKHVFF